MKLLVTIVGVLAIAAGALGLISPDNLISIGRDVVTPTGLYVIAAVRFFVGLVLIISARTSRMPKTVGILGGLVLIAGIATPMFGVAVLNWWASQGAFSVRLLALVPAVIGAFVIYAIGLGRRAA